MAEFNLEDDELERQALKQSESADRMRTIGGALDSVISGAGSSTGHYMLGRSAPKSDLAEFADARAGARDNEATRIRGMLEKSKALRASQAEKERERVADLLGKKEMSDYETGNKLKLAQAEARLKPKAALSDWQQYKMSEDARNREQSEREFEVPGVGTALTKTDASNLKTATAAKTDFDRKLQEMIDLRENYGAEYVNREAVERGKQLSKDLLLAYKDMAKLGVLSQSDEKILNAIIPEDPLANDWAVAQDPILHRLKKFQGDADNEYKTNVGLRLRSGQQQLAQKEPAKMIQVSDGRETLSIPATDLEEAANDGFRPVSGTARR
jgi:hypothetical protein